MSILHYTDDLGTHNPQTAGNYLENQAPVSGDTVILRSRLLVDEDTGGDGSITAGLDMSAVLLARLVIEQNWTGLVGTPNGPWRIGARVVEIGRDTGFGSPVGSQRINLDLLHIGSGAPVVTVFGTCDSSAEAYLPPVRLLLDDANAVLEVLKGSVGLGVLGESCTAGTIRESYLSDVAGDAEVIVGDNVTLATVDKVGGDMVLRSGATAVSSGAGKLTIEGAGAVGTLTVDGGTVYPNASGTIGALVLNGGLADFTQSRTARTVTAVTGRAGGAIKYDPSVVTVTNQITASEAVLVQFSAVG